MIDLYTDGGCSGNPGPGGWAYIISTEKEEIIGSGGDTDTTNNRMELQAVIEGLLHLYKNNYAGHTVNVYTDSQYVQKGMTIWLANWKKRNWRTSTKKEVKNQDLWMKLDKIASRFLVTWHWVLGHAGDERNERCDSLVQEQIKIFREI